MNIVLAQSRVFIAQADKTFSESLNLNDMAHALPLLGLTLIGYGGYSLSRKGASVMGIIWLTVGIIMVMIMPVLRLLDGCAGFDF